MAIDFPASPSLNDTYTFNGRTWTFNGDGWVAVSVMPDGTITTAKLNSSEIDLYVKLANEVFG